MKNLLFVGLGGFLGASFRYLISIFINPQGKFDFPFDTLLINCFGCFLLGLFISANVSNNITLPMKDFIIIGLLGGFTTFSTFGFEAYDLFNSGLYKLAFIYVLSSSILGIISVILGLSINFIK